MADIVVRPATAADLPLIRDLERAAGARFRDIGMDAVADDAALPLEILEMHRAAGRCWVAAGPDGRPVGYLVADVVEGAAHVEQVSVDPEHAGRRIGARLLETVEQWAQEHGLASVTLTTFAGVAWNGPYYARLGFEPVPEDQQSPGLRRIRAQEAAAGLDRWPRIAMRRTLAGPDLTAGE